MNDYVNQVTERLTQKLFVEMEASGRHIHLTETDAMKLFGHPLTEKAPLSQPGQYVCQERVALQGPKGTLERVAVLGPARKESQAEVSLTDAVALGVTAPVNLSGDLNGAPQITVVGETGQTQCAAICAKRHLHMTPEDAANHGVKHGDTVQVQAVTDRPVVFCDVAVRVSKDFATRLHLDYDEANACHFKKGDLGMILHG